MRYGAMLMASALAAAVAACSAGAQEGERPTAQRDFRVGPFHSISLTGSPDVIVTVGGPYSVRAEGDARMVERLEIAAENGDLRIGYRESSGWGFPFGSRGGTAIHITLPALQGATITGSGDIRVNQVRGDRFAATVTGSGDLEIERLETGEAAFAVTGSGAIRAATGSAQRANIQLQGGEGLRRRQRPRNRDRPDQPSRLRRRRDHRPGALPSRTPRLRRGPLRNLRLSTLGY
jgi:hypothetical protein